MKKIFIILFIICLVAISGCAEKKEPIKIGAVLTMTGSGAHIGEEVRDGLNLAIEEVNARGGINGREVELVLEDCKTDKEEAIKIFRELEETNPPHVYVSVTSLISVALAPLAEEYSVPLVGLVTAANHDVLIGDREWVFRTFSTTEDEVPPIISIAQEKKLKSMGILYLNNAYGQSVGNLLKQEFEKIGGEVFMESFEADEGDYSDRLSKFKDLESIYVIGFDPHIITGLKQIREMDYQGIVIGPATTTLPSVRNIPEADGVYVAAPLIYKKEFPFAQEIKSKYEVKYDKPFSHYAGQGYNFVKIIEGLLEKESEATRKTIKEVFEKGFTYHGVFGTLDVKPGDHEMGFDEVSAQIVDGEINYFE